AVMTAGIFPLLHTGRPWYAWWLFPVPTQRGIWVNFNSPLIWDVFAVSTYFTISLLFWYIGLVPDLATVRDRAKNKIRRFVYGVLSLGWRGSARTWSHYEMVYLLLAGLSTPLVLSVHSIVSFDFAVSLLPGWHTTIFPPYFVAGAIFSGFAMVMTLMIIAREVFNLKDYITLGHLEKMNKIMLLTGMMVGYAYIMEFFIAWYSGSLYERFVFINRAFGPYGWAYWIMMSCNVLVPQIFWVKKWRRTIPLMFVVSIFINIGMWFERFVIIVTGLHRDFLPVNWGMFHPTRFDIGMIVGSFGFFMTFFLIFCRVLPTIAMFEVKSIMKHGRKEKGELYA
ncbi:MAG: polysulfide reductase NrfD, partial [Deltaproteobacteria bacterium]|nr:polysulfide reductase NrfD [Deltaproteobacteria bacterium]